MNKIFYILVLCLGLQACTWVTLTPEGEKVAIASSKQVANCKYLGKTHVSVKGDVAGFERGKEKVQLELELLARNEAAKVKGNTIVPVTEMERGKQSFAVYSCQQ